MRRALVRDYRAFPVVVTATERRAARVCASADPLAAAIVTVARRAAARFSFRGSRPLLARLVRSFGEISYLAPATELSEAPPRATSIRGSPSGYDITSSCVVVPLFRNFRLLHASAKRSRNHSPARLNTGGGAIRQSRTRSISPIPNVSRARFLAFATWNSTAQLKPTGRLPALHTRRVDRHPLPRVCAPRR